MDKLSYIKKAIGMTHTLISRLNGGLNKGSMIMRTKSVLLLTACVVALGGTAVLGTPGTAHAVPACGPINTASNPQTVTCTGAFNPYGAGISYDENTVPVLQQGNLQVNLSSTVAETTATAQGVYVKGVAGFNAGAVIFSGASVNATVFDGVETQTSGAGTAYITNGGTITSADVGAFALSGVGGTSTIINNGIVNAGSDGLLSDAGTGGVTNVTNNGTVSVSGVGAISGIFGTDNATIVNAGTVTVNGTTTGNEVSGARAVTVGASEAAGITNTAAGSIQVTATTNTAIGFGASQTNAGSANYTNNGALTVSATTGAAYGFDVVGGTSVTITDAQTAAGAATTTITGSGALNGVSVTGVGSGAVGVNFTGVGLGLNTSGGPATGVNISGGVGDTVNVARTTIGANTYTANMSIAGATGATGVSISGPGANAATYAGASLSVSGGTGNATGFNVFGGTNATVTTVATGGSAAVSVTSAGGYAQGAFLGGTGALTASIGDSLSVTNTGGGATGLFLLGGSSETATLSSGLTVSSSANQARGVYLTGTAATTIAAHVLGPIQVTGTGGSDAQGIHTDNGAAVTIDGAPAITVSGSVFTAGVYVNGALGPVSITTGAVTALSAAGNAIGVAAFSAGGISVVDAGIIDVTGVAGNYGVYTTATGASGAIADTLATVRIHGAAASGSGVGIWAVNNTTGSDATTVSVQQVTASGQTVTGIAGNASTGGAATVTDGSVAGAVHSGGITTTGTTSPGVVFFTTNGLLTITNNGLISTAGATSGGITGSSSGTGGVNINNWQVTTAAAGSQGISVATFGGPSTIVSNSVITTGANSSAIIATTGGGALSIASTFASTSGVGSAAIGTSTGAGATTITSAAATTTAINSDAISAGSSTGAITINSTNASATGAGGSNGVHAAATSTGAVVINLADGGATNSTNGNAVYVTTGGTAAINVGSAANTSTVSGGMWGINSTATGGTALTIKGTVTGGGGAAIKLAGGADTISNTGTINGFVNIVSTSDVFTNAGTWNTFGGNSTFDPPGLNTFNNTGTLNVVPSSTTATTISFLAPGVPLTFNNSGVINLQQTGVGGVAHTGDALNIGNAVYTGSGAASLHIDANLGNAVVGVSGAQTADELLVQTGSVAGSTSIVVNDVGAALPGKFNFVGIPVVLAGSSSANAFSLAGGSIDKGYVQYRLTQSGSNYYLVGLPSESAFEIGRTGAEAQSYWRRSGDVWADQMRESDFHKGEGLSIWAQASVASDTQKSHPTYQVVAVNTFTFTPNLDIDNQWSGAQFGVDYGMGHWGYGLTAGFGQQLGHFKADSDHIDLNGGNFGAYARWESEGLFFDLLAKYDGYTVKQKNQSPLFEVDFNGSTVGAQLQGGYRWTNGSTFVEPVASLAWSSSNLNAFNNPSAGAQVNFDHSTSLYGNAGLRVGTAMPYGDWMVTPYAGAYIQGEMSGDNKTTITAGANALQFADPRGGANGRFELGVSGHAKQGLQFSAAVDGTTGGSLSGISGRIGLAYRW
jgi:uncharacterized protein YhjY with autotransporter beta-barrel domain